ncbi:MAG TPA: acetyl-CoA carboxylase biotin carboxyl carrier protein subunit, partial [Nitrospiraceae bacterium]
DAQSELDLPEGAHAVSSHVTGTIWKLLVKPGEHVTAGSPLLIVESMKMEIVVDAPVNGTVRQVFCKVSGSISAGQLLLVMQQD